MLLPSMGSEAVLCINNIKDLTERGCCGGARFFFCTWNRSPHSCWTTFWFSEGFWAVDLAGYKHNKRTFCVKRLMWLELAQRRATCFSASFCRAEMKDCWFAWAWADRECNSLKVVTEFDFRLLEMLPVTAEKTKVKGETVRVNLN